MPACFEGTLSDIDSQMGLLKLERHKDQHYHM
jgi:hypothetical protein